MSAGHFGDPAFLVSDGRTGRNISEVFGDFFPGGLHVDIACKSKDGIRRTVVGAKPFLNVFERGGVQVFHGTDDGPGIGVTGWISIGGDEIVHATIGLVFTLTFFILDDATLLVEGCFIKRVDEVAHAVGLHEKGEVEGGGGNIFEVVCAVGIRSAVQVSGAEFFHGLDVAALGVLAAAEHEVFIEVSEAGLAEVLILGADVIPDVDGHDGRFVVFVNDDGEAVVEDKLLVRDIDLSENAGSSKTRQPAKTFLNIRNPIGKGSVDNLIIPMRTLFLTVVMALSAFGQTEPPPVFTFQEVMIPVRDGVHLQTVILTPVNQTGPLPILLERTPYGVPAKEPTTIQDRWKELAKDGYIFVIQNLRGRFKSEGTFSLSSYVDPDPKATNETSDAYDTIDWLVKNVPQNNGRVGIYGVSYDGLTAALTLLHPHPALKAVSEQASPADQWMNDDDHRYGALRLSYDFEYAVLEQADKNANTHFAFDVYDTYEWYLKLGPISNINSKYLHKLDSLLERLGGASKL